MNDAETKTHRLLAAGTEDMPPEIDLLGGFAAARRRDRSRRTRRGAVLVAGIAVAAAAVTTVTVTTGSAPPTPAAPSALDTVTGALTRTVTQSYHLSEHDSYYSNVNGQITNPQHDTCTSEADPVRHMLAISCSGPNTSDVRQVGGYTYYSSRGDRWSRIATARIKLLPAGSTVNGFTAAAPQQLPAELKEAARVTAAGPASGPGWTGTRYTFSGTFQRTTNLSGTVTVDQHGRTRALVLTTRERGGGLVMTQALTFSDFGAPVTVTPPPADQTSPSP